MNNIRRIFKESGYPSYVIERAIKTKLAEPVKEVMYGPEKQPVYIKLPYKGASSERTAKSLRAAVHSTFGSVSLRVIFITRKMLVATCKDTLPSFQKSNIIYQFKCNRCESEYLRKSSLQLEHHIKEHIQTAKQIIKHHL